MSKNILFIAPPAGGKSTICARLVENDGYIHIATGNLLRDIDASSDLGRKVQDKLSKGEFVDDDIVIELLKNKLQNLNGKPFILDGFPRNLHQARVLEELLNEYHLTLDLVIELIVSENTLLKRITGRQICPNCERTYNKYFMPPRVSGICDDCDVLLTSRIDDNEETFKVRFDTYMKETYPLIDYYREKGLVVKIDGEDNIYEQIVSVINDD